MAKQNYLGANVEAQTDSFAGWIDKTNEVRYDMGTVVVTTGAVAQPNTTNGAYTSGNTHIEGILSANTIAVPSTLRGGTVSTPATLSVGSNVTFTDSETITIAANTNNLNVYANNMNITSKVDINAPTKAMTIATSGLTVSAGAVQITPDFTASANVVFNGTKFTSTANVEVSATTIDLDATTFTIGANNTAYDLVVNADTTLANTTINNELTVNDDATFTGNTSASTVEATGELKIRHASTGTIRHKSTTTSYQDLELTLETSTGSTKTPLVAFANSSVQGVRGSANTTQDLGDADIWWNRLYSANVETDFVRVYGAQGTTGLEVQGDTVISGDLVVTGVTTLASNSVLSLSESDIVDLDVSGTLSMIGTARVDTALIPSGNNVHNLGDTLNRWDNVYADNFYGDISWANVTNRPDPVVTVNLSGDVAGSGNATLTGLGNGTVNITATVQPNSVALGTDTTGNYVATVAAGAGLTASGTGEGAAVTVSHADTSAVSNVSVNNSNGTVLQDVTLTFDTYGHVTAATTASINLDLRYPTVSFKNVASDSGTAVADSLADTLTISGGTGISTAVTGDSLTITSNATLDNVTDSGNTTTNGITVGSLVVNGTIDLTGRLEKTGDDYFEVNNRFISVNESFSGDPNATGVNGGVRVHRGSGYTAANLRWNESSNRWEFSNGTSTFYNIPVPSEYDTYNWSLYTNAISRGTISSGEKVDFVNGTDISIGYSTQNDNSIVISHADTSTLSGSYGQTGSENGVYIKSITVDARGHLTAVTTDDFDDRFLGLTAKAADSDLLDGLTSASFIRANSNDNVTANTEWQDGKQAQFGNAADMKIYHNNTAGANYITSSQTLYIRVNENENGIILTPNSHVRQYYNNLLRTETTNNGFQIYGTLDADGDITSGGDFNSTSDERAKSNIRPIDNALSLVLQMNGKRFVKDGKESVGVIAQEMEQVLPEVVNTPDDPDEFKSVAYGNIVGVLIEAMKEQTDLINELRARIDDLDNK